MVLHSTVLADNLMTFSNRLSLKYFLVEDRVLVFIVVTCMLACKWKWRWYTQTYLPANQELNNYYNIIFRHGNCIHDKGHIALTGALNMALMLPRKTLCILEMCCLRPCTLERVHCDWVVSMTHVHMYTHTWGRLLTY